MTSQNSCWNHP